MTTETFHSSKTSRFCRCENENGKSTCEHELLGLEFQQRSRFQTNIFSLLTLVSRLTRHSALCRHPILCTRVKAFAATEQQRQQHCEKWKTTSHFSGIQNSVHICTQLCEKFNEFPSSISLRRYRTENYNFIQGISYYFNRNIKWERYEMSKEQSECIVNVSCYSNNAHSTSLLCADNKLKVLTSSLFPSSAITLSSRQWIMSTSFDFILKRIYFTPRENIR